MLSYIIIFFQCIRDLEVFLITQEIRIRSVDKDGL